MRAKIVNDSFFNNIDSEIKAYLLGFFLADGCISLNYGCKNSYCLNVKLSNTDEYIISLFKENICPDNKILYNNNQSYVKHRKITCNIKWTSTIMKKVLEENFNIKPRKTFDFDFIFPFEKIPNSFLFDFIRGFFDGDGHISYNEITHQNTFALYMTSYNFAKQIGEIFEKNFNVKMVIDSSKKKNIILYCLRFNSNYNKKEFMFNLYKKFYVNKNYYLIRKKEKIQKYLMFKYRVNQEDFERLLDNVERSE